MVRAAESSRAQLDIVGTGIQFGRDLTEGAVSAIRAADEVLYLVNDPLTEEQIVELNKCARSLAGFYHLGKLRSTTYEEISKEVIDAVMQNKRICFVLYGHPGVAVAPARTVREYLQKKNISTRIIPGISAEDCLFADVGIDPSQSGCQSYEATKFLLTKPRIDNRALLILWQIGVVLESRQIKPGTNDPSRPARLVEYLTEFYPEVQQVILYEAALFNIARARIDYVTLRDLPRARMSGITTLVIPPRRPTEPI